MLPQRISFQAMKTSLEALISYDQNQRIIQFDRKAEEMFGYAVSEVLNESMGKLFPIYYEKKYQTQLKLFARNGSGHPREAWLEMWAVRKSGEEFPVEVDIAKFRSNDGFIYTAIFKEAAGGL